MRIAPPTELQKAEICSARKSHFAEVDKARTFYAMTLWSLKGALAVLVCQHPRRSWLWYNYAMSNPAVSVILPVHDAERYLRECIDSVLAQTLREIEVICVDDASTDSSPAILAEYAKRDSRVRVITNSSNRKSGTSRNTGLDAARGEFLFFIDNDDLLPERDMFEKLVGLARGESLDLVMFSAQAFFDDGIPEETKTAFLKLKDAGIVNAAICGRVIPGGELLDLTRAHGCYNCYLWTRMFRTETIRRAGLRFMEGGNNEDTVFTPLATMLARRACAVDKVYYSRRIRPGSVMASALTGKTECAHLFAVEKDMLSHWMADDAQAIVAASGSKAANEIAGGFLRQLGSLFAQLDDDEAKWALDGFGTGIDDRITAAHLRQVRALSRKLKAAAAVAERLKGADKRSKEATLQLRETRLELTATRKQLSECDNKLKESDKKLKLSDKRLNACELKLEECRQKAKKLRQQRDARPNSVRACVKFILRRLFGGK